MQKTVNTSCTTSQQLRYSFVRNGALLSCVDLNHGMSNILVHITLGAP